MAGHEALVSVIMPVYNAEKYLTQALDSLLAQDYPNFEVLCVDDGSMDTSKVILATYARQNPRIRVIRVENGGQARARQIGIQHAKGSLITFMDSDDLGSSPVASNHGRRDASPTRGYVCGQLL